MSVTGQITSQINALVRDIQSYSNAVDQEKQRTATAKADAAAACTAQKAQIQQQADAQIQIYKDQLQDFKNSQNTYVQEVAYFEQQLSYTYPRTRVSNIPPVSNQFSAQDAQDLLAKIREEGFWAWVKKFFALVGYDSNNNMAAELYGKIDNAYHYYRSKEQAAEKKCQEQIRQCEQSARNKKAAADAQYAQTVRNEDSAYMSRMRALEQQERKIAADPRYAVIEKQLVQAAKLLGATPEGWKSYTPAKTIADEVLMGVILYPCAIANPGPEALRLLKRFRSYVQEVNGFTIPLSAQLNQSMLLYAECEAGDVRLAASVYQSIITRMIRYMPPKAFRAVFFDPVNRSTSLGQLIHLTGEGTGKVCAYYLSAPDITTQLCSLTEHVDKICSKLTASGCSDINAYNTIPGVSRIPYMAVVIHDYPNGFDSNSLGYLQVLINKASQCGISIMISHKQGDKIEHRALDVLNVINRTFHKIQITAQAKASITMGTDTYRYKPNPVSLPAAYLDGINKLFTYKPPLENGFAKLFGGKQPAYRSARRGLDIPFAVDSDGKVIDLQIGYDRAAYGFISGGVGSGKTTALHMLISSAILHYTPAELELWLIDYKEAEFAFYMRNCPPHVRYVVADKSSEISYSILDEIAAEIQRRNDAFITAGVKDYVEYADSAYGKANNIPRLLVIIDEFHRMSQAAEDEGEYKRVLENIFAEARSSGITLLLCDQDISGLRGLTPKSRRLLSARIALRNSADEIRETLAAENTQLTEDVKRMILDTSAGVEGSAIYKYEVKDPDNPFANKVMFKSCRGIFATSADRTGLIGQICGNFPKFDRDKTFFVGATRQKLDVKQIKNFEKWKPQRPDLGERFYIGTPLGVQPCFYFNLKPYESGENILLVGNNHEKRLAILRATLASAGRYGYRVKILASKAAQLYRQNRPFFESLKNVELITFFPEICKYIGQQANRLKQLYSDEDDFQMETSNDGKELVIFVGLDELYAQMEASPYTQKTAWAAEAAQPETPRETNEAKTPADMDEGLSSSLTDIEAMLKTLNAQEQPQEQPADMDEGLASSLTDIEAMLAALGDEETAELSESASVPEKFAGPAVNGIKGYNAIHDLALLFADGWKNGINSMVIVDRGTVFNKMRQVKLEGNFNHRIALVMSPDEAQSFMTKTRTMKTLIDGNDAISAVYEYLGGREQCFRPYLYD